jgi:hypothetical protein
MRAALSHAVAEELLARNPASMVRLTVHRKRRDKWWLADEARAFPKLHAAMTIPSMPPTF